jgi:hypothetical protein
VLKVVLTDDNSDKTAEEFRRLLDAYHVVPSHVVQVKHDSFRSGEFQRKNLTKKTFYSGYLIEDIGVPMQYDSRKGWSVSLTAREFEEICRSLNKLHLEGIYHGDARVPNVIDCNGNFKWIDFHHVVGASQQASATSDVKRLIESMYWPRSIVWGELSQSLLKSYGENLDIEHMLAILRMQSSENF